MSFSWKKNFILIYILWQALAVFQRKGLRLHTVTKHWMSKLSSAVAFWCNARLLTVHCNIDYTLTMACFTSGYANSDVPTYRHDSALLADARISICTQCMVKPVKGETVLFSHRTGHVPIYSVTIHKHFNWYFGSAPRITTHFYLRNTHIKIYFFMYRLHKLYLHRTWQVVLIIINYMYDTKRVD